MKPIIIISLLCLSAAGSYAQSNDNTTDRQAIKERATAIYERTNGNMGAVTQMHYNSTYSNVHALYPDAPANAVPATPSSPYVALQNPPCYKYKNSRGLEVMECPGARFLPDGNATEATVTNEPSGNLSVQKEGTYLGYYNNIHSLYPQAPANAVAAYPTGPYTELQNPPCYSYTNKRGLKVMECPGARFEPEHDYDNK